MSTEAPGRTVALPVPVGRVVMVGTVFGFLAGVVDLVVYGLGRLLGVPFLVQQPGGSGLALVPWYAPLLVCLLAGVVGGLLASLVRTLPSGPTWVMSVGLLLGVLSLASPLLQPAEVGWSTRGWLVVMHVLAIVIIVPALSRGTTSEDPPPGEIERLDRAHPRAGV